MQKYYGKYRAIVKETDDPEKRGRIRVECDAVFGKGNYSGWCLPCFPPGMFAIPPRGSLVWVEFEDGMKNAPIWVGTFYTTVTFKDMFTGNYNPKDLQLISYDNLFIKGIKGAFINNTAETGITTLGTVKAHSIETTGSIKAQGNITSQGNMSTTNLSASGLVSSNSVETNSVGAGSITASSITESGKLVARIGDKATGKDSTNTEITLILKR